VLVVVHVPPGPRQRLVPLFQAKCRMAVKEAEDKEPVPACLFRAVGLSPAGRGGRQRLALSTDEPVNYSRPSIDVLFESAADAYGEGLARRHPDRAPTMTAPRAEGGARRWRRGDRGRPAGAYAAAMPETALEACPRRRP
jgi:two-component system chemotaxis response regulator CheB